MYKQTESSDYGNKNGGNGYYNTPIFVYGDNYIVAKSFFDNSVLVPKQVYDSLLSKLNFNYMHPDYNVDVIKFFCSKVDDTNKSLRSYIEKSKGESIDCIKEEYGRHYELFTNCMQDKDKEIERLIEDKDKLIESKDKEIEFLRSLIRDMKGGN